MKNPSAELIKSLVDYLLSDYTGEANIGIVNLVELRVYAHIPPADRTFPLVLIEINTGGSDIDGLNGTLSFARVNLEIVGLSQSGDISGLVPIADRLETLLNGYVLETDDIRARFHRLASVQNQDALTGIHRYSRLGAEWGVTVSMKG